MLTQITAKEGGVQQLGDDNDGNNRATVADETQDEAETRQPTEEVEAEPEDTSPSRDALLEAVSNRRRRYTLHYLQQLDEEGPVDLSEISRQVAAWERGVDLEAIGYDDRKNVHTSLYQFHAPKLADLGLITYDKRSCSVELTAYGRNLRLDLFATENQHRLTRHHLVLSALSGLTVGIAVTTLPVFRTVPDVVLIAVVAPLFVLSVIRLLWENRTDTPQIVTQHPPDPVDRT